MSTTTQTSVRSFQSAGRQALLSRIGSQLVKSLIFELLVIVTNVYLTFMMIGVIYSVLTDDNFQGSTLYFAYLSNGTALALFVVGAAFTTAVAIRTWRMLSAANSADVASLKRVSSPGWAIIAGLAGYVVPGIWLYRINGLVRSLELEAR